MFVSPGSRQRPNTRHKALVNARPFKMVNSGTPLPAAGLHALMEVWGSQSVSVNEGGFTAGAAIMGAVIQDELGTVNPSFPCGLVGYGYLSPAGFQNSVFPFFARGDHNTSQGVVVSEMDVNMMTTDSANVFPPNLGFPVGAAYGICLQLANIGIKKGHTALRVVNSAQFGTLAPWLCGIYMDPPGVAGMLYGLFIDGTSSFSAATSVLVKNTGQGSNVHGTFQTMGTAVPANPVLQHLNSGSTATWLITQGGTFLGSALGIGPIAVAPDSLLTINANTQATTTAPAAGTNLHIVGVNSTINEITMDAFTSANAMALRRLDGGIAGNTAVPANAQILNMGCSSWDGSIYGSNVGLVFFTNSLQSGSDHSGYMDFKSTPIGSTTYQSKIRLQSSGGATFGNAILGTDPGAGSILLNGNLWHPTVANTTVATVLGSLGPAGANTTVQEWFPFKNAAGTTRYVPGF